MIRATLNGSTVAAARVQVPAWGLWWADVTLTEPVELAGAVTLAIGGLSLSASVVHGGPSHGRAAYRLVAGKAGWGRELPTRSYLDDAGVKVSTIAQDAARAAGEALGTLPTTRRGPHYQRQPGPATATLNELFPRGWYADLDGFVQVGQRPATVWTGNAPRVRGPDKSDGIVELAVEDLAGFVPGVQVDGLPPASDVEFELDAERLTVRVYAGPSAVNRRVAALARILDAIDSRRRYRGTFEFRVVSQSGERFNLQPVRVSSGMSDLLRVPIRPPFGVRATASPGALVLVSFADTDPSRPQIITGDAPDAPGWLPIEFDVGAEPRLFAARMTDPVQAGPFAGTIVGPCSLLAKIG